MNLLPKTHEEFSHADYWNTFFKKRGKKVFEWYKFYNYIIDNSLDIMTTYYYTLAISV